MSTISPKGKFRSWQLLALAIATAVIAFSINSPMTAGWGSQSIIQFAKASAANAFLYGVFRVFLHQRTHELPDKEKYTRQNWLILAHAVVTGCVLAAG